MTYVATHEMWKFLITRKVITSSEPMPNRAAEQHGSLGTTVDICIKVVKYEFILNSFYLINFFNNH